jgi:hypothetical protein
VRSARTQNTVRIELLSLFARQLGGGKFSQLVYVFAKSGLEFFKNGLDFVLLSLDSPGAQIADAVVQFRQRHVREVTTTFYQPCIQDSR